MGFFFRVPPGDYALSRLSGEDGVSIEECSQSPDVTVRDRQRVYDPRFNATVVGDAKRTTNRALLLTATSPPPVEDVTCDKVRELRDHSLYELVDRSATGIPAEKFRAALPPADQVWLHKDGYWVPAFVFSEKRVTVEKGGLLLPCDSSDLASNPAFFYSHGVRNVQKE